MIITALHSILSGPKFTHLIARNVAQAQIVTVTRDSALHLADAVMRGEATFVDALQGGQVQLTIQPDGSGNRYPELQFHWLLDGQLERLFSVEDFGDHRTLLATGLRASRSEGEGQLTLSLWTENVIVKAGTQTLFLHATPDELLAALRCPDGLPDTGPLRGINLFSDEMGDYACPVVAAAYHPQGRREEAGELLISLPELRRAQVNFQGKFVYGDRIENEEPEHL